MRKEKKIIYMNVRHNEYAIPTYTPSFRTSVCVCVWVVCMCVCVCEWNHFYFYNTHKPYRPASQAAIAPALD